MKILLLVLLLGGCATGGATRELQFDVPPNVGARIVTDRHDVRCESREGARFTSATGFFHTHCSALPQTGLTEWQVLEREYEELNEGGMWLLRARRTDGEESWLVLPWHDWA